MEKFNIAKLLIISYSAEMLFSTVLSKGGMVQIVWYHYPGVVNMVQFSLTFLHKIVTVCSMELLERKPILLKWNS